MNGINQKSHTREIVNLLVQEEKNVKKKGGGQTCKMSQASQAAFVCNFFVCGKDFHMLAFLDNLCGQIGGDFFGDIEEQLHVTKVFNSLLV